MDIEHCREFLLLAARLNFTEAASELNMTQPALSKHVLSLEKELGAPLLDRSTRTFQLTEAGRIFSENASAIIAHYEEAKRAIAQLKERPPLRLDGDFGDTDIASFASMATLVAREEEQCRIVISDGPHDTFMTRLANNELDAFIGYEDPDKVTKAGFAVRSFMETPLVAIVGTGHHLANRPSLLIEDLASETLLHCGNETIDSSWKQIVRLLESRGIMPRTRFVPCDSLIACFTTPLKNDVLLWKGNYREIRQMLVTGNRASIPLENDVMLTSYLIYRPEEEGRLAGLFRAVEKARELLRDRKDNPETQHKIHRKNMPDDASHQTAFST